MSAARHRRSASAVRPARVLPLVGVVLIGLSAVVALLPASAGGATADAASSATSAGLTVTGTARFADLRITIGQTTNLINQVVPITWTGGKPTYPSSSQFQYDYLQIMQCWGDAASGPTRSQCQYGGRAGFDNRGGDFATTRQVDYGALVDPLETIKPDGPGATAYVPFTSVTGKTVTGNANEFFDNNTTNEVAYGRTRSDGSGQEFFEVQTIREAPGLGCGGATSSGPRTCWLVIVPRDDVEVSGAKVTLLRSSPLSQSNWNQRIVVPLSFASVGQTCPLGAAERRTSGSETVVEAIGRWQPALCADGGSIYGFSQVADSVAKRQLASSSPQLAFLNTPVAKDEVVKPLVYAPVAVSGLTLSFLIESQSGPNAPPAVKAADGERITELNLTPRLVAKLLTQSYRLGVDPDVGYLKRNPFDLTKDPDFLAINPSFRELGFARGVPDVLVPVGLADVNAQVWEYVATDEDALNFIQGLPDPWGMRVNPAYQRLSLPTDQFPKADPFCKTFTNGQGPLCTLDQHAYAADLHDAARAAGRGDPLARSSWDPQAEPPQYKKTGVLAGGQRALMAVADTPTAARYGLVAARLRNAAGRFVAPTRASLLAGYVAMKPSGTPGVVVPHPQALDPAAYPLVTVTYAVTAPAALTEPEARDYAALVRYAAGKGQELGVDAGQLPEGYLPLPSSARRQALAVAAVIEARGGPDSRTPTPTPSATATDGVGTDGSGTDDSDGSGTDGGATPAPSGPTPAARTSSAAPTTTPSTSPVAQAVPTPATAVDPSRLAVAGALLLGGAAALLGSTLPWLRRRLGP